MQKFLDEYGLARVWQNIKSYIQQNSGSVGSVDIPSGIVCAWSGTESNVPSGWHLCDGTNGTPDLRDRFILGAGTTHSVGETGGSEEVTLTVEQMPNHKHNISKKILEIVPNSSHYSYGTNQEGTFADAVPTTSVGGSQPHPNMPPYYTLCYIMKL